MGYISSDQQLMGIWEVTQMKPRKNLANDKKIPDDKLEAFLFWLVNARVAETGDDTDRLYERYSQFLPCPPSTPDEATPLLPMFARYWCKSGELLPKEPVVYKRGIIAGLRERLRDVWKAEDEYTAEWRLFHFQSGMNRAMTDSTVSEPLPEAPLTQALAYLWRKLGKLKKCLNPDCPKPFFIAAKVDQKVCGLASCIAAKVSESQRDSWRRRKLHKLGEGKQPEGEPVAENGRGMSGKIQGQQPRIAEPAIKAFILDVANADDKRIDEGELYFFSRYPEFFPTKDADIEAVSPMFQRRWTTPEGLKMEVPLIYHRAAIGTLRDRLRDAWQAEDEAAAGWQLFLAQSALHGIMDVHSRQDWTLQPPSALAPIPQALRWVRQNFSKLRKCGNGECPRHRFFVATGKARYCSRECRQVGQKPHKRGWWNKHGQEWRRKQAEGKGDRRSSLPDQHQR